MCGNGQVLRLLHLLQYRIRLTGCVNIARHQKNRNVVCRSGSSGSDHVAGAGAYGRSSDECLLAAQLAGECNSGQSHALLVLALVNLQVLDLLLDAVAVADTVAVARDHEDAADKLVLNLVAVHINIVDILIFQEADASLAGRQTNGFHVFHLENSSSCIFCTMVTCAKCILIVSKISGLKINSRSGTSRCDRWRRQPASTDAPRRRCGSCPTDRPADGGYPRRSSRSNPVR